MNWARSTLTMTLGQIQYLHHADTSIALKRQDRHSSPLHKVLYLFFFFVFFFQCLSPIRYKLLPKSAVFIASVLLSGPLDHVKNYLIMCSNYRNSSQRSCLSFVNLPDLKIISSKTVPWSFCKAWKCELISLLWFPGVVNVYLGQIRTDQMCN